MSDPEDQNTVTYQRGHWSTVLRAELAHARHYGDWGQIGWAWGDPESPRATDGGGRELGNYLSVLRQLRALITSRTSVVEIGSYGGKWTHYLLDAAAVWCVDLSRTSRDALHARFGPRPNLTFYETPGDDLRPIPPSTVDLVFSMDSLVRAPLDNIASYLVEFHRVLRVGGHVLVHLPWVDLPGSRERHFTQLTREWLLAHVGQFSQVELDETTLKHGLLLHLVK